MKKSRFSIYLFLTVIFFSCDSDSNPGISDFFDGICDEEDPCMDDPDNDIDGDGICGNDEILGCTDPIAVNYNELATDNYGCAYIWGCTDLAACNYDENATEDDGSCFFAAENYDSDGNCLNNIDGDGLCG